MNRAILRIGLVITLTLAIITIMLNPGEVWTVLLVGLGATYVFACHPYYTKNRITES